MLDKQASLIMQAKVPLRGEQLRSSLCWSETSHDLTRRCHFTAQHMWKISNLGLSWVVKRILFLCVCVSLDFHRENLSTFQHAVLPCLALSLPLCSPPCVLLVCFCSQSTFAFCIIQQPCNHLPHTHRDTDTNANEDAFLSFSF